MFNQDNITNKIIVHHEAGHAVMARLLGRSVKEIVLRLNVKGTYNGETDWDRYGKILDWDKSIPFDELKIPQQDKGNSVAVIYAAGKAAEILWYRKNGMDESLASFGSLGENDEMIIDSEINVLIANKSWLKPEQSEQIKQTMVEEAVRLLDIPVCWQAIEAVAKALLKLQLEEKQHTYSLNDVQQRIATAFATGVYSS